MILVAGATLCDVDVDVIDDVTPFHRVQRRFIKGEERLAI